VLRLVLQVVAVLWCSAFTVLVLIAPNLLLIWRLPPQQPVGTHTNGTFVGLKVGTLGSALPSMPGHSPANVVEYAISDASDKTALQPRHRGTLDYDDPRLSQGPQANEQADRISWMASVSPQPLPMHSYAGDMSSAAEDPEGDSRMLRLPATRPGMPGAPVDAIMLPGTPASPDETTTALSPPPVVIASSPVERFEARRSHSLASPSAMISLPPSTNPPSDRLLSNTVSLMVPSNIVSAGSLASSLGHNTSSGHASTVAAAAE
jgi:hypothetical protein